MMEWIKIKDRAPEYNKFKEYLFVNGKREVVIGVPCDPADAGPGSGAIYINDSCNWTVGVATHWMELPEPPKKEEN